MSGDHWTDELNRLNACPEAVEWAKPYGTFDAAWQACERVDWMLWLAGKYAGPPGDERRKPLVLAACECARMALPYVQDGEERPRKAIEVAERWANGDESVSLDDVSSAADAVYAASATDDDSAAYAADAAYSASSAADASNAATYAADAAYATDAAYAADSADARPGVLKQCVDIVRKHYPTFDLGEHDGE